MTFTPETPTEPGDFAWKAQPEDDYFLCRVAMWGDVLCFFHNSGSGPERGPVSTIGGLWCRLVPVEGATAQGDSLVAAIEGDYSGMAHADLVATCKMLASGRETWRKEAEALKQTLAVEVEKAFREGWHAACDASSQVLSVQEAHWDHSRAKRVAEGKE